MNIEKFTKAIDTVMKLKDDDLFSPSDITKMGLIFNTRVNPCIYTLYRFLRNGEIKAMNLASDKWPRYVVRGAELKKFVQSKYKV